MFFDLTKEIELNSSDTKRYFRLRLVLYFLFFLLGILVVYFILFPTQLLNYSFLNPASNKGSVLNPRDEQNNLINNGEINSGQKITFDASLPGKFSRAVLEFTVDKNSTEINNTKIFFRKSYQAALLPEGKPLGLKDGTLVRNGNNFFIVSEDKLRQFQNEKILLDFGFSPETFMEVSSEDMKYNEVGEIISNIQVYPNSSLFEINGAYYKLINQTLFKFISPQAFFSEYEKNQAIPKNSDFLLSYPINKKNIGFSDSSLISYGQSAFVASQEKIYPIGSPEIFLGQGFDWQDIINVNGDEISLYEKEKMFSFSSAHPDGTIFLTSDTNEYYIINNNQKHRLLTEKIATSYLKKKPIVFSAKSLDLAGQCQLTKTGRRTYSCEIFIEKANAFPGPYYEFKLLTENNFKIDNLNVAFKRNATKENFWLSVSGMVQKIRMHFGIKPSA
jgi:hypothetical protein